jgi:hypothetical protein
VSTRQRSRQSVIDARLGQAAVNIDELVARARVSRQRLSGGVARRIDALRAREAHVRARVRKIREDGAAAWTARSAELRRELDELDSAIALGRARLETELAVDEAAFAEAVRAELEAWTIHMDTARTGAALAPPHVHDQLQLAIQSAYDQLQVARHIFRDFREAPSDAWPTVRADVTRAIEDLDRSFEEYTPCTSTCRGSE